MIPTGTPARAAAIVQPDTVAFAPNGDLAIALGCANEIVAVQPNGTIREVMGTTAPFAGSYGIGNPALNASPDGPHALAYNRAGYLYVFGFNDKSLLVVTPAGVETAPIGTENFYPKTNGGIAEAADGAVVAADLQTIVRLSPTGEHTVVDFGAVRASALDGIANFLPAGIAEAPDGTIYTDTNPDYAYTTSTAIVRIPPGGSPHVLWLES